MRMDRSPLLTTTHSRVAINWAFISCAWLFGLGILYSICQPCPTSPKPNMLKLPTPRLRNHLFEYPKSSLQVSPAATSMGPWQTSAKT
ncbi:hypothetical protein BST61_g3680 [Cercospora zeina]